MWENCTSLVLIHAQHLAARAWFAMVAGTGTNTLGVVAWSLVVPIAVFIIQVGRRSLQFRKTLGSAVALRSAAIRSIGTVTEVWVGVIVVAFCFWVWFIVETIYQDHSELVRANSANISTISDLRSSEDAKLSRLRASDVNEIANLKRDLEAHRHAIFTTDPVFPNIIYMLQAFSMFRTAAHGEMCVMSFTVPASGSSGAMAMTIAQLSNSVSGCNTIGPDDGTRDPDIRAHALNGMVSDAIVLHAGRDDKAANTLFDALGNQIKIVRSYDVPSKLNYIAPPGGFPHTIWLQFGDKVEWNSERVHRRNVGILPN